MISAEDLQNHATSLIASRGRGAPRQIELRRAISAAYYSLFHHFAQSASDLAVGRTHRNSFRYVLAYRSIQHGDINSICLEVIKPAVKPDFRPDSTTAQFDPTIREWALAFQRLYRARQDADYDPNRKFYQFEAEVAVSSAQEGIEQLERAPRREREWILSLVLFYRRAAR